MSHMQKTLILYSIIDDRSRFSFNSCTNKTAKCCAYTLQRAIKMCEKPAIIKPDNGGENKGKDMETQEKNNSSSWH